MRQLILGIFFSIFFLHSGLSFAQNHSEGLHLQLSNNAVTLGQNEIEQLQIAKTRPGYAIVLLKLLPDAATKLHNLTANYVGQTVVWVWNGRVLSMKKLTVALDKDLAIPEFTTAEAEAFRDSIKCSIGEDS